MPNTVREQIAKNILFYRTKRKMTQRDIAKIFKTNPSTVSSWERGANSPDLETLYHLCEVLQISVNTMFGVDDSPRCPQEKYSQDEQQFIEDYRSLNNQGQEYIRQTMYMAKQTYKKLADYSSLEADA